VTRRPDGAPIVQHPVKGGLAEKRGVKLGSRVTYFYRAPGDDLGHRGSGRVVGFVANRGKEFKISMQDVVIRDGNDIKFVAEKNVSAMRKRVLEGLDPDRAARLLVAAMRSLGDVPGHEFHGNQWTAGEGGAAVDRLKDKEGYVPLRHFMEPARTNVAPLVDAAIESDKGAVRTVSLTEKFKTEQEIVGGDKVKKIADSFSAEKFGQSTHDLPRFAKNKETGELTLTDGNHRVVAALLRGEKNIKAVVVVLPAAKFKTAESFRAARAETPLHRVADAHEPKLAAAVRYAFALGRRSIDKAHLRKLIAARAPLGEVVMPAANVVARALGDVLPVTLRRVAAEGGRVAAEQLVRRLRAAGDVAGHEFHGNQWTSGSMSTGSDHSRESLDKMQKQVVQRISELESKGLDSPENHDYAALAHMDTAISLQRDAPLSQRQYIRSAFVHDEHGNVVAAGVAKTSKDKKTAEVLNVGATQRGAGKAVMDSLHEQLRARGVKRVELTSTARTFYERAGYTYDETSHKMVKALEDFRTAKGPDPKTKVTFTFNAVDQRAVDWADHHAAEMVTKISETTRQDINDAIAELLETGDWETAYEDLLDAVGDNARAERIAHHEVMTAVSEGQREAWDQAVDEGLLVGDVEKTWVVTPDAKLCPICESLDSQVVKLKEPYTDDEGEEYDGPPAHVGCRCTEGLV